MRGLIVSCFLVLGTAAVADDQTAARAADGESLPALPARSPPDESPTQFACTTEKLLQARRCTWEFEPTPGEPSGTQSAENSKKAAVFAQACGAAATGPEASRPDPDARKQCEGEIAKLAIERCGLDGRVPFEDPQGKLSVAARGCVEELLRVLARTQTRISGSDLRARPTEGPQDEAAPSRPPPHTKTKAKSQAPSPLKI